MYTDKRPCKEEGEDGHSQAKGVTSEEPKPADDLELSGS